jgi:hypothetical protein
MRSITNAPVIPRRRSFDKTSKRLPEALKTKQKQDRESASDSCIMHA